MLKFKSFLLLLPLCLWAQVPAPPAPPKLPATLPPPAFDKVILSVGDEKMTVGEFEEFLNTLPEQFRAQFRGPGKRQLAEQLVLRKVLAQEAKRRKIDQSAMFQKQLASQTENLLAQSLYQDLAANQKLEEASVRRYYDEHKNEFEQVRARHILVRVKGSAMPLGTNKKELTEEEALAKAQELRKRLVAGEDFATLAKAESDDTTTGANGGDLGLFKRGQMVPSFDQAAFSMAPGQLSEPVKSQFGYHLIRVEQKESKTFDEMRPDLEKRMRPDAARQSVEELKKKASVTIDDSYFGPAPPPPPPPGAGPTAAPPARPPTPPVPK